MAKVKIKFDANQEYQLRAIDSVLELFGHLGKEEIQASMNNNKDFILSNSTDLTFEICPNVDELFCLNEDELLTSFDKVCRKNHLPGKIEWNYDYDFNYGETLQSDENKTFYYNYPQFVINMETGTGKTYVYLRTIFSLYQKFGFKKFVIVVPSIAIYEGVLSTFEATKRHFQSLFETGTVPHHILRYDGNVSLCKDFGTSSNLEILLMTIDSFNGAKNVIYKQNEKIRGGKLPIEFIQDTRPILILDEVQNYKTEISKRALRTLNPLFSLGYSATPGRGITNEIYRLSSFEASQMNLVKKIDVSGTDEESISQKDDYFKILDIQKVQNSLVCDVQLNVMSNGALHLENFRLKTNDDFYQKTKNPAYQGISITQISVQPENTYVEFSNGVRYCQDSASSTSFGKEIVFRQMIADTIEQHIQKQFELREKGYDVKVLSLFFIDRVVNYVGENAQIARIFDEEFAKVKHRVERWKNLKGEDVREGYFAKKSVNKKTGEEVAFDIDEKSSNAESREAEKKAYNLIMKGKERLLSKDENVCFIFAHSALREGWDNPNVFQICALREITTENNRRQTIGRGLRLPVNQEGERVFDPSVNHLTVFANESYSRFVKKLQEENVAEGIMEKSIIGNSRKKKTVTRTSRFDSSEFEDIWRKANRKTEYEITIKTEKLIEDAIKKLNETQFDAPQLVRTLGSVVQSNYTIKLENITEDGQAKISIESSNDETSLDLGGIVNQFIIRQEDVNKNKLGKITGTLLEKCPELANLKIVEIHYSPKRSECYLKIEKIEEIHIGDKVVHETYSGCSVKTASKEIKLEIPKCNIIERACNEIKITRRTVLDIFKGLEREKIQMFMKNPEGFTAQFISVLKDVVADHIADNIKYTKTSGGNIGNKEDLFLKTETHSQVELQEVKNQDRTIYDMIQVDSEVERNFVKNLDTCDQQNGNVKLFFKFPSKYKIDVPKIIGNYNPDWAIVRRDEDDEQQIELVRETKSTEDLNKLWHSNEKRKIICARKHFNAVGLEYRVVDDKDKEWWKRATKENSPDLFPDDVEEGEI